MWLRTEYAISDESFAAYRIVCALALILLVPDVSWVATIPAALFLPHAGPMQLWSAPPSAEVLQALRWLTVAGCVLLGAGIGVRFSGLLVGLLVLLQQGFSYSVESIHHHVLLALVPIFASARGWDRRFRLWPSPANARPSGTASTAVSLALLAVATGFMFLTAALPKVLGGWLDPDTAAAYSNIVSRGQAGHNSGILMSAAFSSSGAPWWELFDWLTVVLEGAVLFTVPWRRAFLDALALLTLFHAGVYAFMGVDFWDYLIAYAALVDWYQAGKRGLAALECRRRWMAALPGLILGAGVLYSLIAWHLGILIAGVAVAVGRLLLEGGHAARWCLQRRTTAG